MHIPVSVPNVTVGTDVCLEGPSDFHALAVEPSLNTVQGSETMALVVNITGSSVKLKQGMYLCRALVYNSHVLLESLDIPQASVDVVKQLAGNVKSAVVPPLDSLVKTVDFPELRLSLLKLLCQYRDMIALPGESLGSTDKTEHLIRLKPGTKPVYVPAYRLPHSRGQIVDKPVSEMLEQGVIQHSRSPWNSPLFFGAKKGRSFLTSHRFQEGK